MGKGKRSEYRKRVHKNSWKRKIRERINEISKWETRGAKEKPRIGKNFRNQFGQKVTDSLKRLCNI